MKEIKKALRIASLDPKVAQTLSPLIESYLNLEEATNQLEIKLASESRAQKKTKAQKAYRQIGRKKSRHHAENQRILEKFKSRPWELPYKLLPPDAKKAWSEAIFMFKKKGKVPKYNKPYESLSKEELTDLRRSFLKKNKEVFNTQKEDKKEGSAPKLIKNESFRKEVREKALGGLKGFSDTLAKLGDEGEITEAVSKKFNEVREIYGVEKLDVSKLTGEELEDFRDTLVAMDRQLTREYNDKQRELQNNYDKELKKIHAMREKANEFEKNQLDKVYSKLEKLTPPRPGLIINDVTQEGAILEAAVKKYEKERDKLIEESDRLEEEYDKMMEEADEADNRLRNLSMGTVSSMMWEHSWDGSDVNDSPEYLFDEIEKRLGEHKRVKAIEKKLEEEKEETKQTIKDYKKKVSDLASKVKGINENKGFMEALSELNLMRGQLSNSKALSELEADFSELEKTIKDEQEDVRKRKEDKIKKELEEKEKNSFKGKLKSFFGLGKKASEQEILKCARYALHELEMGERDINKIAEALHKGRYANPKNKTASYMSYHDLSEVEKIKARTIARQLLKRVN